MIAPVLGGRFRLEHALDSSGMGTRYLASDLEAAEAPVAVIVMRREVHAIPEAVARLRAEVRVTRMLRHPHIARVHSFHTDALNTYLVTEYVEGQSLAAHLEHTGQGLPLDEAVRVVDDLCVALAYSHELGVVHGDVQPATAYITPEAGVKLVDFGMMRATRLCNERFDALWVAGRTMAYASVDVLEGRELDARDDVYSLACLLYTLLSGAHPFGWHSAVEARRLALAVPSLAVLSRKQNAALERALAFERTDRTPGVNALLADLGWASSGAAEPAAGPAPSAQVQAASMPVDLDHTGEHAPARSPASWAAAADPAPSAAGALARYRMPAIIASILLAGGIGLAFVYDGHGTSGAKPIAATIDIPAAAATHVESPLPASTDSAAAIPTPVASPAVPPVAAIAAVPTPAASKKNSGPASHAGTPVPLLRPLPQAAAAMAQNDNCPYPREAVKQGLTGTVLLSVFVTIDGRPEKTRMEKTSGSAVLDEAAVRCVERFGRFLPPPGGATSGGYWGHMRFNWTFGS